VPIKERVRSVPSKEEIREYFAKFGRKGGKATAKKMTPEQRKEIASNAAKARWAKEKKAPTP
jgi:general stress protein YciG